MIEVNEILYDARALIGEYSDEGVVVPSGDIPDIEANGIRFLNMALREGYKLSNTFKEFKHYNIPLDNLLATGHEVEAYSGEDEIISVGGVNNAKTFTCSLNIRRGKVQLEYYINGAWEIGDTFIFENDSMQFEEIRHVITNSGYPQRVRFRGILDDDQDYYTFTNVAMYEELFIQSEIPLFDEYLEVDLPDDFAELNEVYTDTNDTYSNTIYKFESFNTFKVLRVFDGEIKVKYTPQPQIAVLDDEIVMNSPILREFVTAYVASRLALDNYPDLINYLTQLTEELKRDSKGTAVATERHIIDVYGSGTYG